jgi:hypothetical protein
VIRETFQFDQPKMNAGVQESSAIGEGAYIAAEINSRRYYGVLIDQDSLRAASILHLQDEASGLELNERMESLLGNKKQAAATAAVAPPGTTSTASTARPSKRSKMQPPTAAATAVAETAPTATGYLRGVQKFRYVPGSSCFVAADNTKSPTNCQTTPGYRILLATYCDIEAAAETSDQNMAAAIQTACERGGDFVGDYYYQYQVRTANTVCDSL